MINVTVEIPTSKRLDNTFESKQYVWQDPYPIEGNDYRVSYPSAEVIDWCRETYGDDYIITIQYNDGLSEAEVYITELKSIP